jgi:hypothetical protein
MPPWKVGSVEFRRLEWRPAYQVAKERGQLAPAGTVHAVDSETGDVACGFGAELLVFDIDFATASLQKCAACEREVR